MKRNKFSLSHYHMTTLNQGALVPVGNFEVLPGDTVQMSTSALVRAAPLVAPVMHPVHCRIHHWYVPYRILWAAFESFITGGPTGTDATVAPFRIVNGSTTSLMNYLGIPVGTYVNLNVSALPLRAYAKIFNEWYRDQDLVAALAETDASGADATTNVNLLNCAWEKDYFTSARPFQQKGTAAVVPINAVIPQPNPNLVRDRLTGLVASGALSGQAGTGFLQAGATNVFIDTSLGQTIDINALRNATSVQRYMEARARFGSRYSEYLRYLGVKSDDARLQRPEYLGGGKQTIQFSEVLQSAEGTNPVGMMRGHGIAAMKSNRFRRFIPEHGLIMTLMSVKPRTVYMQAMNKSWFRTTKEDYWQRELEHLGQQAVTNKEIYAMGASPNGVFGYQDRYDEYRRQESRVSGEFSTTLNYWHMARDFASAPTLNASFVESNPTNRVYAATTAAQMYVMAMHSIQVRRMLTSVGSSSLM